MAEELIFFPPYAVLASSCNSFHLETKIGTVYYNTEYEITTSLCVYVCVCWGEYPHGF